MAGGLESVDKVAAMLNLMGGNTDLEQRLLVVRPWLHLSLGQLITEHALKGTWTCLGSH